MAKKKVIKKNVSRAQPVSGAAVPSQLPSGGSSPSAASAGPSIPTVKWKDIEGEMEKRKGGRPKGRKDSQPRKPRGSAENAGGTPTPQSFSSPPPQAAPSIGENPGAKGASAAASTPPLTDSIPPEAMEEVLKAPFLFTAALTGFDGFELKKEEAKAIAPLTVEVVKQYAPTMGPHGAALALSFALIALTGTKAMAYAEWKRERRRIDTYAPRPKAAQEVTV